MKKSFSKKSWEGNIYSKGKHLNSYPYDILVSIIASKYFYIPVEKRSRIKVLDLGCGAGNHSKFLAENGFDVFGYDGSVSAINICKDRFTKWKLSGNFQQGDFLDLPYDNNFFDIVVDRESIYANRFRDIKSIVSEVFRCLRPGGFFISFAYNVYHPDMKFGRKIEKNTYSDFNEGSFNKTGVAHFYSTAEIKNVFKKFTLENLMRHSVRNITGRFMDLDEFIIVARKSS